MNKTEQQGPLAATDHDTFKRKSLHILIITNDLNFSSDRIIYHNAGPLVLHTQTPKNTLQNICKHVR